MKDDILNPVGGGSSSDHLQNGSKAVNEQKEEIVFEEGVEEIPLPSCGYFYNPPFYHKESLHVRQLDWRDEDILTTKRYIDDGTVFDKVVSATLQEKGISSKKLVPVDRDTILLWLRSMALGKDMTVDYKCPACGHKNTASWDLTKLDIPKYPEDIVDEIRDKGELKVITPIKNLTVYVKVPLIEESNDTEKRLVAQKNQQNLEHDLLGTGSLKLVVSGVELEGGKIIRGKKEIEDYFNKVKLPLSDSRFIRKQSQLINLRYDTAKDLECSNPECDHVQEGVELPIIHPNFFWPDA